ncbi:MAG: GGDEF and EAL domain-containing protein [Desulfobulbaceae bacterium]|nr:MAG: GGDEF and EAL domain-containing protein [Desulfobulbaceae bacterium]
MKERLITPAIPPQATDRQPTTIRRQALLRIIATIALLTIGSALAGTYSLMVDRERDIATSKIFLARHYTQKLLQLESSWLDKTAQIRQSIEYLRNLEESEATRWATVRSYLTTQAEFQPFFNLIVLASDGATLFRHGPIAHDFGDFGAAIDSGWHFSATNHNFYRILTTALRLGPDDPGQMVLFYPLTTAMLASLQIPDVQLSLEHNDKLIVNLHSGQGGSRTDRSILSLIGSKQITQVRLPWPYDHPSAPTLIIQYEFESSVSFVDFVVQPLVVVVILMTALLWLSLGRWLTRLTRRLESLGAAGRTFAIDGQPAAATRLLAPATAIADEIGQVAATWSDLVYQVDEREHEQRAHLNTLAILNEAVLELDNTGLIVRASPGWRQITGSDQPLDLPLAWFIHRQDRKSLDSALVALRADERPQANLRLRLHIDSEEGQNEKNATWLECRLVPRRDLKGKITGFCGVLRDDTQTNLHKKQINHMALHDTLTDLPNQVLLEDRLKLALLMAKRRRQHVAVCFIDLDHFKRVNDSLGHKAGDRLLIAFAARLRDQLRAGDTVARWGGDEFVLLLSEIHQAEDTYKITDKIAEALQFPFKIGDGEYTITYSMGVAIYPDDATEVDLLLSRADRTMSYAKSQGRNQTCFFSALSDHDRDRQKFHLQNKLVEAVTAKLIEAWFQPIVTAADNRCLVAEVLARWHDPDLGWISPATFIPLAEDTGVINALGHQIWLQALAALAKWRERGHPLKLAVNISKRQLLSPKFTEQLVNELELAGLAPTDIALELTESIAILDAAKTAIRLDEIRQAGFKIAIDDFGTGYSALSRLHEIPINALKIDISFVRRLHEESGHAMIRTIVQLAKLLNLQTTAEGVEDAATADKLRVMRVDFLQGYHFAKPMNRNDFTNWLFSREDQDSRSGQS